MRKFLVTLASTAVLIPCVAMAAGDAPTPPKLEWPQQAVFGTYDKAALQRGFQVYKQVCSACHGMKHLAYRNLRDLGYSEAQVKTIAAEYMVTDGPDDEGEMFERPARPSDTFFAPFANEKQARYANNGAYPLDLSLIVQARHYGADYIAALLSGYSEAPAGKELMDGMYWNKYYAGHQIAMAPPLMDGQLEYADGTEATVEQMAYDVASFLTWAGDPHHDDRKRMGLRVMLFLLVLSVLMYLVKKKIWRDVEH